MLQLSTLLMRTDARSTVLVIWGTTDNSRTPQDKINWHTQKMHRGKSPARALPKIEMWQTWHFSIVFQLHPMCWLTLFSPNSTRIEKEFGEEEEEGRLFIPFVILMCSRWDISTPFFGGVHWSDSLWGRQIRSDGCSDTDIQRGKIDGEREGEREDREGEREDREREKQTLRWWSCCPVLGGCSPIWGWPRVWRRWGHVVQARWVHTWNTGKAERVSRLNEVIVSEGDELHSKDKKDKTKEEKNLNADRETELEIPQHYVCLKGRHIYYCEMRTKRCIQKYVQIHVQRSIT